MEARMGLAAEVVVVAASTIEVVAPATAMEEGAVTETATTHQGLGWLWGTRTPSGRRIWGTSPGK